MTDTEEAKATSAEVEKALAKILAERVNGTLDVTRYNGGKSAS